MDFQPLSNPVAMKPNLTLTDSEHFRTAGWAYPLGRWLTVLHRYALRVFHLSLGTTFNTIRFHWAYLPFY